MEFFISQKRDGSDDKILYLNLTAHPINLINKQPNSISKEEYEKIKNESIEIKNIITLNLKEENEVIKDDIFSFIIKHFKLDDTEMELLIDEIEKVLIKNKINLTNYKKVLLLVSLPVLQNFSKELERKINDYFDMSIFKVVGVINATERGIYPPLACMYHFGIMEE